MTFDLNGIKIPKQKRPAEPFETAPLQVCPFSVIVDTREQLPYTFSGMGFIIPTVRQGLANGDYSIQGLEGFVSIERKSLDDLFGSLTWERDRFEREVARLNEYSFAAVVTEAVWVEIVDPGRYRIGWENQTNPNSMVGTINHWMMRYPRVHWVMGANRRWAETRTFQLLQAAYKEWQGSLA